MAQRLAPVEIAKRDSVETAVALLRQLPLEDPYLIACREALNDPTLE